MRLNEALNRLADLQHLHKAHENLAEQQAIIDELTNSGYPVTYSDEVDTYLPSNGSGKVERCVQA